MHITAEGLTSITESIQSNNSINTINMSVCNIELFGNSKVKLLQREIIMEHISQNCSMVLFDLQGNNIDDLFLRKLDGELEQNK